MLKLIKPVNLFCGVSIIMATYSSPAGPGLGWNKDYAQFNKQGQFTGISNTPQKSGNSSSSSSSSSKSSGSSVKSAADAQAEAARKQAEAERQAAAGAYKAKVASANESKKSAGEAYNWIVNTLGSNKQDLLDKIAVSEKTGLQNYETQKADVTQNYDKAKQDILYTYRDLGTQQEKILRGSGASPSSSRSQEAMLKLNNLMGKDLSSVTKTEADSLALIGNAVTLFKEKSENARMSVERETKSKLDKAGLDYTNAIRAIDADTRLAANQKADEYKAAEVRLAQAEAQIKNWAIQAGATIENSIASSKSILDSYVADAADYNGSLNADLATKQAKASEAIAAIDSALLINPGMDNGGDLSSPSNLSYKGGKKSYSTKEELDAAYQSGEITGSQYQTLASQIQYNDPLTSAVLG